MIRLLNPSAFIYLYISIALISAVFTYLIIRRRRFIKQIGVGDNVYWYIVQLLKVIAVVILVLSMSIPVTVHVREKYLPLEELSPELKSILMNLTVLHVLIVDESLSMLYVDEYNVTRAIYSSEFIENYLKHLSTKDLVLIVGFAEDFRLICAGEPARCLNKLDDIKPGRNYTDISGAIDYAKVYADASQHPSIFLVVTDGAYTKGGDPFDLIVRVNKTYPVLFVRVGFDPRASGLVIRLNEVGVRVLSINAYTKSTVYEQLPVIIDETRLQAFIAKNILEVKTVYEDLDPSPTLLLIITSCILFIVSKIEGF